MKKLLLLIVVILVAYVAWKWWHRSDVARGDAMIYDRFWIDHMPASETEKFQVFVAETRQPYGRFAQRTQWTGQWEVFRHEKRGDGQLELVFPHSKTRQRVTYRAWKCSEPKFDFCLELSAGRGARKYFSQRGWEIHGAGEADALAASLVHD